MEDLPAITLEMYATLQPGKKYTKPLTYLFKIRQGRRESLWDFTSRFTKESIQVEVVEDQKPPRKEVSPKNNQNKEQIQNIPIGEIVVVHGGLGVGGDSNRARKAHLRKLLSEEPVEVNLVERPSKLEIEMGWLRPVKSTLMGFSRKPILPKGRIALIVTVRPEGNLVTCMVYFLVVDRLAAYNLIVGRSLLNQIGAVVPIYHLKMKFPMGESIAEVRGSQKTTRECYNCTLKNSKDTPIEIYSGESVDVRDEDKLVQGEPVEDFVEAELDLG
ncbi:hypothetical protein Vadar_011588 [Vaccinium darrowii]|nr:hypothetical protein Vadar_011588 [Vaccinium darrowii]